MRPIPFSTHNLFKVNKKKWRLAKWRRKACKKRPAQQNRTRNARMAKTTEKQITRKRWEQMRRHGALAKRLFIIDLCVSVSAAPTRAHRHARARTFIFERDASCWKVKFGAINAILDPCGGTRGEESTAKIFFHLKHLQFAHSLRRWRKSFGCFIEIRINFLFFGGCRGDNPTCCHAALWTRVQTNFETLFSADLVQLLRSHWLRRTIQHFLVSLLSAQFRRRNFTTTRPRPDNERD